MEVVLDEYTRPYNPEEPLVCIDEASKELHGHLYEAIAMKPGRDAKTDLRNHGLAGGEKSKRI